MQSNPEKRMSHPLIQFFSQVPLFSKLTTDELKAELTLAPRREQSIEIQIGEPIQKD